MTTRLLSASLMLCAAAVAGDNGTAVEKATKAFQQRIAPLPDGLRLEFQLTGAAALEPRYPKLSHALVDPVFAGIREGQDLSFGNVRLLALASPEDAVRIAPLLSAQSRSALISSFVFSKRTADAVALFRLSLAKGELPVQPASGLLKLLSGSDPQEARVLFQKLLEAFPADPTPNDAWQMINCADAIGTIDPKLAAAALERILAAAAKPDYGAGKTTITVRFQKFETTNTRDTLLAAAGSRLRAIAPDKAAPYEKELSKWDLSQPVKAAGITFANPGARPTPPPAEYMAISKRMSQLRSLTDDERPKVVIELAGKIDALLASGQKLNLASGLANLSTEGDLGKEALMAVAATLAHALHENPGSASEYVELASLVRYEHVPPPAVEDPAEKAAESLLALREEIHLGAGFSLTGLDGKTYTLDGLKGKVVLLNFWATWCPPCRKEMPDMEKLSRKLADKGLVVLAVSDEPRETVAPFIEKAGYTFPILLDPDRKVNDAFDVTGIPKTFIFDREGRIAAQAIDMRTEGQFLELLQKAGISSTDTSR